MKSKKTAKKQQKPRIIGKPFLPGRSGNLNGRPRGQRNYATIYREALIEFARQKGTTVEALENTLLQVGFTNALKGNHNFYKDVLDRIHGKPKEFIEHTGEFKFGKLESLSNEELEKLADKGEGGDSEKDIG